MAVEKDADSGIHSHKLVAGGRECVWTFRFGHLSTHCTLGIGGSRQFPFATNEPRHPPISMQSAGRRLSAANAQVKAMGRGGGHKKQKAVAKKGLKHGSQMQALRLCCFAFLRVYISWRGEAGRAGRKVGLATGNLPQGPHSSQSSPLYFTSLVPPLPSGAAPKCWHNLHSMPHIFNSPPVFLEHSPTSASRLACKKKHVPATDKFYPTSHTKSDIILGSG